MQTAAVLLAAGMGTRMRSAMPKALHSIAGRPMLLHLLAAVGAVFDQTCVVVGPDMEQVAAAAAPHKAVVQRERLGTAHAALQAEAQFGDGLTAVLYADNPLIGPDTLRRLLARAADTPLVLLAMRPADPARYGRVITDGANVLRIVEYADATEAERAVGLCNAGVFVAAAGDLRRWLRAVGRDNAAGEYYLTDVVAVARAEGARVGYVEAHEDETRGVNSRGELALAEAIIQRGLRSRAMNAGATLIEPASVTFAFDTVLGRDVLVEPHVVFAPGVLVADGVTIRAFSHLEDCVIERGAVIGPYARLRPKTVVGEGAHVGNFVELKAVHLGAGAKANHLTYLGDATVGARANIGAGSITCNYDGVNKHRTVIGEGAFIGSDTAMVAPVTVGAYAVTAAGSVITDDVPDGATAFGRARQVNKGRKA